MNLEIGHLYTHSLTNTDANIPLQTHWNKHACLPSKLKKKVNASKKYLHITPFK